MENIEGYGRDGDQDETAEEKVVRLGNEVKYLMGLAAGLRDSLPPITRPPVPEPLMKLRHAAKEKDTERILLHEHLRASKAVEVYLQKNPCILEKVDECPICLEPIFDVLGAEIFLCCGKATCKGCAGPLKARANNTCPLCRGQFPVEGEELSILQSKAAAGYSWAQSRLATRYGGGTLGLAADEEKAEYLYRKVAEQGHSNAQFKLGLIERKRNNYSEACRMFEAAASRGHMCALGYLGMQYEKGHGVEKDTRKAVGLLTISAKLQNTDLSIHSMLGVHFLRGEGGLQRSLAKAAHYIQPFIESNANAPPNVYASLLLGISDGYYPDLPIPPSGHSIVPVALFWYRRGGASGGLIEAVESYESKIKELCACCYKPLSNDKPKCCIECKAAYYCNRECQAADWKAGHKKDCVKSLKKRLRATGKFEDL